MFKAHKELVKVCEKPRENERAEKLRRLNNIKDSIFQLKKKTIEYEDILSILTQTKKFTFDYEMPIEAFGTDSFGYFISVERQITKKVSRPFVKAELWEAEQNIKKLEDEAEEIKKELLKY